MIDSQSMAFHAFASRVLLSRLMRHCFLGRYNLFTSFRELPFRTCIPFCRHWNGGLCQQQLVPDHTAGFQLGRCICQKCYVISVVSVHNCLCGVSSASFLCQLETFIFHYFYRRSQCPGYIFVWHPPASAYLHRCISWLTARSRVNM